MARIEFVTRSGGAEQAGAAGDWVEVKVEQGAMANVRLNTGGGFAVGDLARIKGRLRTDPEGVEEPEESGSVRRTMLGRLRGSRIG